MGEPPIEPRDSAGWCSACGEPVSKKWTGEKYVNVCACSDDNYAEDED